MDNNKRYDLIENNQIRDTSPKNRIIGGLLCAAGLLGLGGLHYFYIGKIGRGLLYLFTFGLFAFGTLIDFSKIAMGTFNGLEIPTVEDLTEETILPDEEHRHKIQTARIILILQIACIALYPMFAISMATYIIAMTTYIMATIIDFFYVLFLIILTAGLVAVFAPEKLQDTFEIQQPFINPNLFNLPAFLACLMLAGCFGVFLLKGSQKARIILAIFLAWMMPLVLIGIFVLPSYALMLFPLLLLQSFALYGPTLNYYFAYKKMEN